MKLSIVVPAYNEEENISEVICKIEESVGALHELIIVNDHSSDKTRDLVLGMSAKFANVKLEDNNLERGFANALKTGFKNTSGDVIIPVMGDLCDDLATIKIMLDKINQGYDVVCGSRYISQGARLGGPRLKAWLSRMGGASLHYLIGIPTRDIANSFKMYKSQVLDAVDIRAQSFEVSMEITVKAYYAGFKIIDVPTRWRERTRGKSSFRVFKLLPNYLKFYFWALSKRIRG